MKRKVYKSENVDVLLDPERQKRSLFFVLNLNQSIKISVYHILRFRYCDVMFVSFYNTLNIQGKKTCSFYGQPAKKVGSF